LLLTKELIINLKNKFEEVKILGLIVENVSKSFGEKLVVNNINFEMKEPGVFGLLGTNGAGKTTTIRMILNIVKKNSGVIKWNDKPTAGQIQLDKLQTLDISQRKEDFILKSR